MTTGTQSLRRLCRALRQRPAARRADLFPPALAAARAPACSCRVWHRALFELCLFVFVLAFTVYLRMKRFPPPPFLASPDPWRGRPVLLLATALWRHYMISPWTRDGRIRVETIDHRAGSLRAGDGACASPTTRPVSKGDVLFVIDPRNYEIAVEQASAGAGRPAAFALQLARLKSRRPRHSDRAFDFEGREGTYDVSARVAAAAVDSRARPARLAKLNLERTIVRSPVNGYVANLRLREGDYVTAGQPALPSWTAIPSGSPAISRRRSLPPSIPATRRIRPDGLSRPRADGPRGQRHPRRRGPDPGGAGAALPNVNPVFTWVRLAQRVPVRIEIDPPPADVTLVAGMTATVGIGRPDSFHDDLAWALRFWRRGWRY